MTYLIFHIVGYTRWETNAIGQQEMIDKVVVRLIDKTYESALKRAQDLIKRDQWVLAEVVEYKEDK